MIAPLRTTASAHIRSLATGAIVAAALGACGGSYGTTSVGSSIADTTPSVAASTSPPGSSAVPPIEAVPPTTDVASVPSSASPVDPTSTVATVAVNAVCFPGGIAPTAVDLSDAFFSPNGCTFAAQGDGDTFWTSLGYRRVDVLGATYVNESLRCAVNSGMAGVEPGTTRWSVLCGNAYPADVIGGNPTVTEPPAAATDDLAVQLWPTGLSLPDGFAFAGVQDHPERGFADFTIEHSGDGVAEEAFWTWAQANLDGVSADEAVGEQDVSYQGRHVEIFQMGDTSFRLLLAD